MNTIFGVDPEYQSEHYSVSEASAIHTVNGRIKLGEPDTSMGGQYGGFRSIFARSRGTSGGRAHRVAERVQQYGQHFTAWSMTLNKLGPDLFFLIYGWHRGPSGGHFIVMEYFSGGGLDDRPHNEPAVAEFEVDFRPAATYAQTLGAPCMVHGAGICCHSLISSYVRIGSTSKSKIKRIDFGNVQLSDYYKLVPCGRDALVVDTRSPGTILLQLLAEVVKFGLKGGSYQRLEEWVVSRNI